MKRSSSVCDAKLQSRRNTLVEVRLLLLLLSVSTGLEAGAGQELLGRLSGATLDPAQCYRVREVHFTRDEAQLFFTDGYLIFAKSVGDTPTAAFFSADVEGGDAEILLLPPVRSERRTMSAHTGSPNLEEHFGQAAMVFSADSYRELMAGIERNAFNKKSPEMGALLAQRWSPVLKGMSTNFGMRLATDLLSPGRPGKGFFAAALSSAKLGAINLIFDPRSPEQLLIGSATEQGFDVWSSFTSRSFRGHPYTPEFAITDYRIQAKLDQDLTIHASTRLTVKPASPEAVLPFEITDNMRVTGATVGGLPAEVLVRARSDKDPGENANGNFVLLPAKPLSAGQAVEVLVQHEGKVIQDAGNHVFSVGSRGSWYPNRGRQFARFDMTFRVPKELDLVAAGDLIEDRVERIERISHWKTAVPIRLAGFNLGQYDRVRATRGDFTIEICANRFAEASLRPRAPNPVFLTPPLFNPRPNLGPSQPGIPEPSSALPPTPKMRLQALAAEIGDVMDYYTAKFGPLQLKRLEVTPVPGRFGQGFPGMIYLSTLSYLEPDERAVASLGDRQKTFFTDLLHAHEAAHQWWGNIVTSAAYHDDWLMESLANYSALLYLEKRKGPKIVETILEDYRLKLLEKRESGGTLESAGPVVQGTRLEDAWIPVVYGKGTWILHMLRRRMGDEPFFRMLSSLRKEWEDKTVSTEEFRTFCARFLPTGSNDPKLESFFDEWVYGTGVPALKLTSSIKGSPGHWRVTGTLTQSEAGEDFSVDVPVQIQLGRSRTMTRTVTTGAEPVAFEFALAEQPTKVAIAYGSVLHR